jgi:AcrR family transcriptional regulator
VSAPTLYWHVRNKRQLLDLMAEALGTVLAVGDQVIGCAVEYQAEAAREPDPERDARLLAQVRETGDLPNLQAALATGAGPDYAASFEHGLAC